MRRFAAAWLLLLVPAIAWGEVKLDVKGEGVRILVAKLPFTIEAPPGAHLYIWNHPSLVTSVDRGDKLEVTNAPKGEFSFQVKTITVDFDKKTFKTEVGHVAVIVGEAGPGPKPPDPPPGPDPPTPPPLPEQGLRVLMVYESKDWGQYPVDTRLAMNGKVVSDYLNAKCAKVANHPEWRLLDKDDDTKNMSKLWQDAMKRPRTSLPWLLISDGKTGFEGPVPANEQALLELLKKYGGQ